MCDNCESREIECVGGGSGLVCKPCQKQHRACNLVRVNNEGNREVLQEICNVLKRLVEVREKQLKLETVVKGVCDVEDNRKGKGKVKVTEEMEEAGEEASQQDQLPEEDATMA